MIHDPHKSCEQDIMIFFLVMPKACRNSWARAQTLLTAVTGVTEVTIPDPKLDESQETSLGIFFFFFFFFLLFMVAAVAYGSSQAGDKSELQLPAYDTAMTMPDLSHV